MSKSNQTVTVELTRDQLTILRDALHEWKDGDDEFGDDPGYSQAVDELIAIFEDE